MSGMIGDSDPCTRNCSMRGKLLRPCAADDRLDCRAGLGLAAAQFPSFVIRSAFLILLLLSDVTWAAPPVDMGPVATSGAQAIASMPDRSVRVIAAHACGDEVGFLRSVLAPPDHRPLTELIAKAAFIVTFQPTGDVLCRSTMPFHPGDWNDLFAANPALSGPWSAVVAEVDKLNADLNTTTAPLSDADRTSRIAGVQVSVRQMINQLFNQRYGGTCDDMLDSVTATVFGAPTERKFVGYGLSFKMAGRCLLKQINHVLLDKTLTRDGHNPGTNGLPCGVFGKAAPGDWDFSVTAFTRLTLLLQAVRPAEENVDETARSLRKLNERLLTLSGDPAAESYPLWTCGNGDNSYGTARDRLDDKDFYDEDLKEEVDADGEGDAGGWEFLGFLLLLLLIILAALLTVLTAGALAAILGPVVAGIIIAAGAIAAIAAGAIALIVGLFIGGIEETENHLLMQNSAKYLKNKLLLEELRASGDGDGIEAFEEDNDDLREWFFKRFQRIAKDDFAEFNARPYIRLSTTAILNLHDFACIAGLPSPATRPTPACGDDDVKLVRAAAAILDMNAAKMALGSSQGRRLVPFRRLAHTNTDFWVGRLKVDDGSSLDRNPPLHIMQMGSGADHMIAAMQFWTAQTQHAAEGRASRESLSEMIWHATSSYRPHALILDIAIDKSTPFKQFIANGKNGGWEHYASGPGWLLTAGGTTSGFAQGLTSPVGTTYPPLIKDDDRGVGVPTTLMALASAPMPLIGGGGPPPQIIRQDTYRDFLRFEGTLKIWPRDGVEEPMSFEKNLCLHASFACGVRMQIPEILQPCLTHFDGTPANLFFIDSSTCPAYNDNNATNDFVVVVYRQRCKCSSLTNWGFIEIYERSYFTDLPGFAKLLAQRNSALFPKLAAARGDEPLEYHSLKYGTIKFDPDPSDGSTGILKIDNKDAPDNHYEDWPRARGDVINQIGDEAHFTITNPKTQQRIEIDLSDAEEPRRVLPN